MYSIYCKLRDAQNLRDSDVSKATGITKSTFSDWKRGRSKPKQDKLQKIADYFGVTIDYLMTGESEQTDDFAASDDILNSDLIKLISIYQNLSDEARAELLSYGRFKVKLYDNDPNWKDAEKEAQKIIDEFEQIKKEAESKKDDATSSENCL